jgi:uncharacterized protein YcbK (DUF882 family)
MLNRRAFLKASLLVTTTLAAGRVPAQSAMPERVLTFYHLHTGERRRAAYWSDGSYVAEELTALNLLLRDHRSGEVATIDLRLFDILHDLQQLTDGRGEFSIISGYRSPATNAALRRRSHGVAEGSLHTQGRALDIRLAGVDLDALRRAALSLRAGGVGYYPRDQFLHLDTGRVRTW